MQPSKPIRYDRISMPIGKDTQPCCMGKLKGFKRLPFNKNGIDLKGGEAWREAQTKFPNVSKNPNLKNPMEE